MKESNYQELVQVVTKEVRDVLSRVSTDEVSNLVEAIMIAEKAADMIKEDATGNRAAA